MKHLTENLVRTLTYVTLYVTWHHKISWQPEFKKNSYWHFWILHVKSFPMVYNTWGNNNPQSRHSLWKQDSSHLSVRKIWLRNGTVRLLAHFVATGHIWEIKMGWRRMIQQRALSDEVHSLPLGGDRIFGGTESPATPKQLPSLMCRPLISYPKLSSAGNKKNSPNLRRSRGNSHLGSKGKWSANSSLKDMRNGDMGTRGDRGFTGNISTSCWEFRLALRAKRRIYKKKNNCENGMETDLGLVLEPTLCWSETPEPKI